MGAGYSKEARMRITASGGDVVSESEAQGRLPKDERGPADSDPS